MKIHYTDRDGDVFAGRHMRKVQAKWERLSMSDLAQIKTKAELVARVEEHYGLPHEVAVRDVELWHLNRSA